jgi:hypothetical protein
MAFSGAHQECGIMASESSGTPAEHIENSELELRNRDRA